MQTYKLGLNGITALALGLSPLQILKSGRIRQITFSGHWVTPTAGDFANLYVAIAAVDEEGVATASPVNIAAIGISVPTGTLNQYFNMVIPCDYQVTAGQNLVVNSVGLRTSGAIYLDSWVIIT